MKRDEIKQPINIMPTDARELIVRTGDALTLEHPKSVSLSGTIQAPGDFVEKRKTTITPLKTHVNADYGKRTITLTVNEQEKHDTFTVTGKLEVHPALQHFTINGSRKYKHQELYNLLKMQRAYFTNKDQHGAILNKLSNFDIKIGVEMQDSNNFKGSKAQKRVVEVTNEIDMTFELSIPVFSGFDSVPMQVEICTDYVEGAVVFWLESIALHELLITKTEEVFKAQLDRLADYVIIKQF